MSTVNRPNRPELTEAISRLCDNRGSDEVIEACFNILANALYQTYPRRADAEERIRVLFHWTAETVLGKYDSVTGRRREVIPFDQVITPQLVESRASFPGLGPAGKKVNGSP